MAAMRKERRSEMYPAEMASLVLDDEWDDGRYDCLFCRISAVLDREKYLRAEVTWMDDGDDRPDGKPMVYYDPMITLESNRPRLDGSWETVDAVHIPISGDIAVELVKQCPRAVYLMFDREIAGLELWKGVGDDDA